MKIFKPKMKIKLGLNLIGIFFLLLQFICKQAVVSHRNDSYKAIVKESNSTKVKLFLKKKLFLVKIRNEQKNKIFAFIKTISYWEGVWRYALVAMSFCLNIHLHVT